MLDTFPPAYVYLEYNDDPYIQAIFKALNNYQQAYLDAFNGLNLPVYTKLSGTLLDWVGTNLYGIPRPVFGRILSQKSGGPYNTWQFNTQVYNGSSRQVTYDYTIADDDAYKRVLTWNLYRGDGPAYSTRWLKRRVLRFLTGVNGIDPGIQETYLISVTYGANRQVTITCDPSLPNILQLQEGIASGILQLPFEFTYSVPVS